MAHKSGTQASGNGDSMSRWIISLGWLLGTMETRYRGDFLSPLLYILYLIFVFGHDSFVQLLSMPT